MLLEKPKDSFTIILFKEGHILRDHITELPISLSQSWSCRCRDNMYPIRTPLKLGRVTSLMGNDFKFHIWL